MLVPSRIMLVVPGYYEDFKIKHAVKCGMTSEFISVFVLAVGQERTHEAYLDTQCNNVCFYAR